jgi:uncharacterized Zn-binding protein involved in type VI secretion
MAMSGKPAARVSDTDACPVPGHVPNPVSSGSPDVFFNNLAAARVGDTTRCGDVITQGISSILINGKPVAHQGSGTSHGGVIITGSGDIFVGEQTFSCQISLSAPMRFDEQIRIVDEEGTPLAHVPYFIKDQSGRVYKGLSDESGYCPRVYTEKEEVLEVLVGVSALERW